MIYGVRECYATTYRHRMSLTIETYCNVEILFDNRDSNEENGEIDQFYASLNEKSITTQVDVND